MMKIMIHHDTWKHMKTINLGIRCYWYHVFKPNQNQWWDEVPVQTYWVWQLEFHPSYISVTFPTHLRRVSNISPTSRSRSSLWTAARLSCLKLYRSCGGGCHMTPLKRLVLWSCQAKRIQAGTLSIHVWSFVSIPRLSNAGLCRPMPAGRPNAWCFMVKKMVITNWFNRYDDNMMKKYKINYEISCKINCKLNYKINYKIYLINCKLNYKRKYRIN